MQSTAHHQVRADHPAGTVNQAVPQEDPEVHKGRHTTARSVSCPPVRDTKATNHAPSD